MSTKVPYLQKREVTATSRLSKMQATITWPTLKLQPEPVPVQPVPAESSKASNQAKGIETVILCTETEVT